MPNILAPSTPNSLIREHGETTALLRRVYLTRREGSRSAVTAVRAEADAVALVDRARAPWTRCFRAAAARRLVDRTLVRFGGYLVERGILRGTPDVETVEAWMNGSTHAVVYALISEAVTAWQKQANR